jgi:predicted small secreted protein
MERVPPDLEVFFHMVYLFFATMGIKIPPRPLPSRSHQNQTNNQFISPQTISRASTALAPKQIRGRYNTSTRRGGNDDLMTSGPGASTAALIQSSRSRAGVLGRQLRLAGPRGIGAGGIFKTSSLLCGLLLLLAGTLTGCQIPRGWDLQDLAVGFACLSWILCVGCMFLYIICKTWPSAAQATEGACTHNPTRGEERFWKQIHSGGLAVPSVVPFLPCLPNPIQPIYSSFLGVLFPHSPFLLIEDPSITPLS